MLADRLLVFVTTVVLVAAIAQVSSGERLMPTVAAGRLPATASGDAYCAEPCDLHRIVWAGDILLGASARSRLERNGYTWPFEQLHPLLDGDYVIGNAEGPITTRRAKYFPTQRWAYNAEPAAARALADVGFDALSLANNHALDRGPDGLRDTLEHLRAAGIRPFGGGMNADEASAPLLVETPHGAVAVLGFTDRWNYGAVAGPSEPGTALYSEAEIVRQKEAATAAGARWVVAYVHWGENYAGVTDEQRGLAATFARAGYDLVVGHHAHVAQEVEIVGSMPVIYSLGNLVFGSTGRYTEELPGYSVVARTYLGPDGLRAIELACIVTDNKVVSHQPRPCTSPETEALMGRLGPHVTLRGDKGVVELGRAAASPF